MGRYCSYLLPYCPSKMAERSQREVVTDEMGHPVYILALCLIQFHLLLIRPSGNAAVLVVGGAAESLNTGDKQKVKLFLVRRKGFVKIALQHGRDLVPVFGFGENEIYEQGRYSMEKS